MSRIKVLTISDHPLFNSGVAHTMRNIILALLKSDKFDVISLGGGIKHAEYKPQRLEEWKERWTIYPVDGFGDKQIVRSILRQEKIDIILFQSDPRFFTWLLEMENEIRPLAPMVWYGIWDNYPYPKFNEPIWNSVDVFASISKVTYDLVNNVAPSVENHYIPHAVDNTAFKKHDKAIVKKFADTNFKHLNDGRFVVFWNNRNARRKQSGSLVYWFNKFLDKIGREKACLLMHTNPLDPNGQNLYDVAKDCGLSNTEISFSTGQLTAEALGYMYNFADVTINIADAEGFGLCLGSETIVTIKQGENTVQKQIKDVSFGDKILSEDGKYYEIIGKTERYKNLNNVRIQYHPDTLISNEHWVKSTTSSEKAPEWKQLMNIKKGEYLCVSKKSFSYAAESFSDIDLLDWISKDEIPNLEYDSEYVWSSSGYSGFNLNGMSISEIQSKYDVSKHFAEIAKNIMLKGEHKKHKNGSPKVRELIARIKEDNVSLNNKVLKIKRNIKIDNDFLSLVGWYLAEGSNSSSKNLGIEIDLSSDELSVADNLKRIILDKFGTDLCFTQRDNLGENNSKLNLQVSSKILSIFFGKYCGIFSYNKKINNDLMKNPKELLPLIYALFDGDGHEEINHNIFRFSTVSTKLAWQVRNILYQNNIPVSIKNREPGELGTVNFWDMIITGENYYQFFNKLSIHRNDDRDKNYKKYYETEDYYLVPILSIEPIGECHSVDLEVKDSRNFIANGLVVHNSTLESLSCGTPIIVNMTGGLQEQVTDGENWFGIGIEPASRAIIGSQEIPYIFEDRVSEKDVVNALYDMYKMGSAERERLGRHGQKHVRKNYSYEQYNKSWVELLTKVHNERGSWPTKGFQGWELKTY